MDILKIPIYCDTHLDNQLNELDAAWERTTQGIDSGNNEGIKINLDTKSLIGHCIYDTSEKLDDQFFSDLPKVEIPNVIKFIGDLCDMWNKFTHTKNRHIKRKNQIP